MEKDIIELNSKRVSLEEEYKSLIEKLDDDASDDQLEIIDLKEIEINDIKKLISKKQRIADLKKEMKAKEAVEASDEDQDKEDIDNEIEDEIAEEKEKRMNAFNINKGIVPNELTKGRYIQKLIARDLAKSYGEVGAINILAPSTSKQYAQGLLKSVGLTTAQPVVPPEIAETIQLLTAQCQVRKYAKIVNMPNNNITYPRMRAGATAQWLGEGDTYDPSASDFDTLNFVGKKLTGFSYTTLEFSNFSLAGTVDYITSDLANQVALAEDRTFLLGSTAGALAPAYNMLSGAGITMTSTGTDSVSIAADLGAIKAELQLSFMDPSKGVVFGSPAVFTALENLQTSFGVYPFREEIRSGKLQGFTIASTPQIPTNVNTGTTASPVNNGSPLFFCIPEYLIIADSNRYQLRSTDQGSFMDSGIQMNAFAQDLIAYKLANWVDFGVAHDNAVAVLNTVGWTTANQAGAPYLNQTANISTSGASAVKGKSSTSTSTSNSTTTGS